MTYKPLIENEWTDGDGYPTEAACNYIQHWSRHQDYKRMMRFVRSLWAYADWGWDEEPCSEELYPPKGMKYNISTGGWSGNESLIEALENNKMFWWTCWRESRVGGHYEFRIAREQAPQETK